MIKRLLQALAGLLVALGALWSLQGADLVHLKPVLCVADCAELQGVSVQWLATGLGAIAAGIGLWWLASRRR
jgi:apolipoprotein N-acyltransferase